MKLVDGLACPKHHGSAKPSDTLERPAWREQARKQHRKTVDGERQQPGCTWAFQRAFLGGLLAQVLDG